MPLSYPLKKQEMYVPILVPANEGGGGERERREEWRKGGRDFEAWGHLDARWAQMQYT